MFKCLLKVELAKNDLTQKQLSELTGIRLPTISDMVNNKAKHISLDNLNKICTVLNCQPADLYVHVPDDTKN